MVKVMSLPSVHRTERVQEDAVASAAPSADIRGLIDNATADRLYGWVWDAASPEYRLKVELRLAGEIVASTIADSARPDLAGNGVGDGCHAFEFTMTPEWFERRAELTVVAIGVDGAESPLPIRLRRPSDSQVAVQLQLAVEGLLAEQREIRVELAGLRGQAAQLPEVAAVEAATRTGREVQQRLDALELWISRLDSRLGEIATPRSGGLGARIDPWQAVLFAVLASIASVGLALAAMRYLA